MTLPPDVEKFDFGGCCAMVTVSFWPPLTDVYSAMYVRCFARLMLLASALRLDELTALPAAGSAGSTVTAPAPSASTAVKVSRRARMAARYLQPGLLRKSAGRVGNAHSVG